MSDVVVSVGGRQQLVARNYRDDAKEYKFYLREYADVRLADADATSPPLVRVRPGMWIYALATDMSNVKFNDCMKQVDNMHVFYVLEVLQKGATPTRLENGSHDADLRVLRAKLFSQVKYGNSKVRKPAALNDTDLVVSDQPFYIPVDAVVAEMQAVVGVGAATPGFDAPRRVSYALTFSDEECNPESPESELVALIQESVILRLEDEVLQFMHAHRPLSLMPPSPPRSAQHKRLTSATPQQKRARVSSYTPTGNTRGRPPKHKSATPVADNDDNNNDVSTATSPTAVASTADSASAPESREQRATNAELLLHAPYHSASAPPAVSQPIAMPENAVDLTKNEWQQYKPQLTAYIRHLMETQSDAEKQFLSSSDVRDAFAQRAREQLAGEFGDFVTEQVRADVDLAVRFHCRFPDPHIRVVYATFLRPMAFEELCMLSSTYGIPPLDYEILNKARKLRDTQE